MVLKEGFYVAVEFAFSSVMQRSYRSEQRQQQREVFEEKGAL